MNADQMRACFEHLRESRKIDAALREDWELAADSRDAALQQAARSLARAELAEADNRALRQRVTELEAAVTAYLDEGLGGDCFINGTPDRVFDRFRALVPGDQE